MANRIAILYDVFALGNRLNGKLMTSVDILFQGYRLAVNIHHLARF